MPLAVSLNVSANYLLHPDFCPDLQQVLHSHPALDPSLLELEVLESAALDDMDQALWVMQQCRTLGVHFALDDFGTGYSSLTYLRKLPLDTLKIDQSFVLGMLDDADDLGIVAGVIQLAAVFKRQVIAEGVETMAHGMALRKFAAWCRVMALRGRCRHKHCPTGYGSGSSRQPGSKWIKVRPSEALSKGKNDNKTRCRVWFVYSAVQHVGAGRERGERARRGVADRLWQQQASLCVRGRTARAGV
jgi:hypothetical protein